MRRNREANRVLGLTGGIGAGKSTVLQYLHDRYRARILEADKVAHFLQEPGQECYGRIVKYFGREILDESGAISRPKLGAVVYADREKLAKLNCLVHPAVKNYITAELAKEERKRKEGAADAVPFTAVEAALLLEDHYDLICDEIWYIYADAGTRTRRLMESRGYPAEKVASVMKNQKSDAWYRQKCKIVIDNSGNNVENTYEQIDKGLVEHGFL